MQIPLDDPKGNHLSNTLPIHTGLKQVGAFFTAMYSTNTTSTQIFKSHSETREHQNTRSQFRLTS